FIGQAVSGGLDVTETAGGALVGRASWLGRELRTGSSFAGQELPLSGKISQVAGPWARAAGRVAGPIGYGLNFIDYYHGNSPSALLSAAVKAQVKTSIASVVVGASV